MATVTVSKSGTLNPATGVIDNDDATTTAYAAGDTFSVTSGAQLKVNTSTAASRPGPMSAASGSKGTIFFENTSTTTPIVISLNTENSNLSCSQSGFIKARGDWIVIATGTGAASQTIDFSATGPMAVAIDYPPCVWVEVRFSITSQSRQQMLL